MIEQVIEQYSTGAVSGEFQKALETILYHSAPPGNGATA